jgi:hypothetical protein
VRQEFRERTSFTTQSSALPTNDVKASMTCVASASENVVRAERLRATGYPRFCPVGAILWIRHVSVVSFYLWVAKSADVRKALDLRRKTIDLLTEGHDVSSLKFGRMERCREGVQPVHDDRHTLRADESGEREECEGKELHGCCWTGELRASRGKWH